jgi:hypothetical protein
MLWKEAVPSPTRPPFNFAETNAVLAVTVPYLRNALGCAKLILDKLDVIAVYSHSYLQIVREDQVNGSA